LTPDERKRVALETLKANPRYDLKEIAKSLGVSLRAVQLWTESMRGDIKEKQVEKARELRAVGKTEEEIGGELGVSRQTVSDWLNADHADERKNAEIGNLTKPQDDQDALPSGRDLLADTKSPEAARAKAALKPLENILALSKGAVCPDHGIAALQFSCCGLTLEAALNRYAEHLRLVVLEAEEAERT
jgi:predicted transcriptional regulator